MCTMCATSAFHLFSASRYTCMQTCACTWRRRQIVVAWDACICALAQTHRPLHRSFFYGAAGV